MSNEPMKSHTSTTTDEVHIDVAEEVRRNKLKAFYNDEYKSTPKTNIAKPSDDITNNIHWVHRED